METRAVVLGSLVRRLQANKITAVRLDHFQGADKIDGKTIRDARSTNRQAELHYAHAYFNDEPLLWLADGLAFTAGLSETVKPVWFTGIDRV